MQRFSIEYITGNIEPTYVQDGSTDAVIQVSNHDGLLTNAGSNFMHTSLHLEDVYSIISKDVDHVASPLVNDVTNHMSSQLHDSTHIDSSYSSLDDGSPIPSPSTCMLLSEVTPVTSPSDSNNSRDRNTPSPHKDSGIDSADNSPVSSADINKTLNALEKKAKNLKPKSSSAEKPPQSYIALIAKAILDSRDQKCALGEIYRHITEHHPFYDNEEKAWRNSIRYNLSINECFVKSGKDESTGKGNLWAIHPACVADFEKGDYRRRQARRRARRTLKAMKSPDMDPMLSTTASPYSYQTMTPSYVSYHPYAATGYPNQQQYQQATSDATNMYAAQALPHATYYNTDGHYASMSQYSGMAPSGYLPASYGYTQPDQLYLHRPYDYNTKEIKPESTVEIQQGDLEAKWYSPPTENIHESNTVVIS